MAAGEDPLNDEEATRAHEPCRRGQGKRVSSHDEPTALTATRKLTSYGSCPTDATTNGKQHSTDATTNAAADGNVDNAESTAANAATDPASSTASTVPATVAILQLVMQQQFGGYTNQ